MRRMKVILGILAVVVASFAAFSSPAMADDLNCRDAWGNLTWCGDDGWWWDGSTWWWGNPWVDDGISQSSEQEVESGEATQTFNIS